MVDRIAIKVLTGSDLTFFDAIYKATNVGNQKSINLNADVFTGEFYPSLGERAVGAGVEVPVSVTLFGPGHAGPYRFARSITKGTAYKNWRLNGAAVPDPETEPGRFDSLQAGDVGVIEFTGEPEPTSVRIVVVSNRDDPGLVKLLEDETPGGRKTMASVSRLRLREIADQANSEATHPIRELVSDPDLDEILEDAVTGTEPAVRKLRARVGRPITKADLDSAKAAAERVGADGEALAGVLLGNLKDAGEVSDFIWTSQNDAAASWDFEGRMNDGEIIRFDAKSTTGDFTRAIFISGAEIAAAADPDIGYRIIRVYRISDDGAFVRVSRNMNLLADSIVQSCNLLPKGVLPAGFSIDPAALSWEDEQYVERPEEPE